MEKKAYINPKAKVLNIRRTISNFFSPQKCYLYPENYQILKENDFQLPITFLVKMPFLDYLKPSEEDVIQAFSKTPHITTIGDYLKFTIMADFDPTTYDLTQFAYAIGPFPKRFKSYQLQQIVETNTKLSLVYSVLIEKSKSQILFCIVESLGQMKLVQNLKEIQPVSKIYTDEYDDKSVTIRAILKSDKPISKQVSFAAWKQLQVYQVDAEMVKVIQAKIKGKSE